MAEGHRKRWWRGWRLVVIVGLVVVMLAWVARYRLLHGVGAFLINDDAPTHADALYVLGGAPFDRGTYAAVLLDRDVAPIAYATGSNQSSILKALGRIASEAELSCMAAERAGAAPGSILPFPYGTSTFEEAQGVLYHAQRIGADTIVVVTTDFHTRRVGKVFRKRFAGSGIQVLVASAPSTEYDPDRWWESEQGLLMVNNEIVKSLFYALKY